MIAVEVLLRPCLRAVCLRGTYQHVFWPSWQEWMLPISAPYPIISQDNHSTTIVTTALRLLRRRIVRRYSRRLIFIVVGTAVWFALQASLHSQAPRQDHTYILTARQNSAVPWPAQHANLTQ